MYKEPPHQEGGKIQEEMTIMMTIEGHIEIGDPLREGDIQIKVEDPLTEEDTLIEDLLEEGMPTKMEDPPEEEDIQKEGPPDGNGGPLMVEDLLDLLVDKNHWIIKDPLDQ